MINKKLFITSLSSNLLECIKKINENGEKFVVILDKKKVVGLITDGDIRRYIIKKKDLNTKLKFLKIKKPITIDYKNRNNQELIWNTFDKFKIDHIPLIKDGNYFDTITKNRISKNINCDVLIMAGGRGSRLKPLTEKIPKPLIKVGQNSLIGNILNKLLFYNFKNFYFSLGYKSNIIKKYLKTNYPNISNSFLFNYEKKPLGTIGSIKIFEKYFKKEHILVHNSDIISDLNYAELLDFHKSQKSDLTIVTKSHEVKLKHGIISSSENLLKIIEKPTYNYEILTGIYVINKALISKIIKKEQKLDINIFINKASKLGYSINIFQNKFYWLDVGTKDDLELAKNYFE